MKKHTALVSIVVPVHNAERFLHDTIKSVQGQTYDNWELLLIDDCSTDQSRSIIEKYQEGDKRIQLIVLSQNRGVAVARNAGTEVARGRYIAFLDADDIWLETKLEKQILFMQQYNYRFTFTAYEFADDSGKPNGNIVQVPEEMSKRDYLKNNLIWTSTVMVDTKMVSKQNLMMPNRSYGEDALTWCGLLDKVGDAHGLNDVMAYYRRTLSSLTTNKSRAALSKLGLYWSLDDLHPIKRLIYYNMSLLAAVRKRL